VTICTLKLRSFRCYQTFYVQTSCPWIFFSGPNGAGKTSLLEAISLLSPGKGLRNGNHQIFRQQNQDIPWAIDFEMETPTGPLKIQTFEDGARRRVIINEAPLKSHSLIPEWILVSWASAQWHSHSSHRRSYLNRLVFDLSPPYAQHLTRYDQALRQRLHLLVNGERDPLWLESLEKIMAETGLAIAQSRQIALEALSREMACHKTPFPVPTFSLDGDFEKKALEGLDVNQYLSILSHQRSQDQYRKNCGFGVHKTLFSLIHPQGVEALLCSAGEQKGLLLSVALAAVRLAKQNLEGRPLFFLLDEVLVHLDQKHQEWLWEELKELGVNVWMTGIDESFVPLDVQRHSLEGR